MEEKKRLKKKKKRADVQGIVNTPIPGNKNLLLLPLMGSRQFLDSGKGHFWYHEATLIVVLRRRSAFNGGSGGEGVEGGWSHGKRRQCWSRRWRRVKVEERMKWRYNCYILLSHVPLTWFPTASANDRLTPYSFEKQRLDTTFVSWRLFPRYDWSSSDGMYGLSELIDSQWDCVFYFGRHLS